MSDDLREKVAEEIYALMDNSIYDCNTNRAVARDRILALFEHSAVERERKAFVAGTGWILEQKLYDGHLACGCVKCEPYIHEEAARRYPLPKEGT